MTENRDNNQDGRQEEMDQGPSRILQMELLFEEEPEFPDAQVFMEVLTEKLGPMTLITNQEKGYSFGAQNYLIQYKNNQAAAAVLHIFAPTSDSSFFHSRLDQVWEAWEEKDDLLERCKYVVFAGDMLAQGLSTHDRARLDLALFDTLTEIFPNYIGAYIPTTEKLLTRAYIDDANDVDEEADQDKENVHRFLNLFINARYFRIEGTEDDGLVDTLGMNLLLLPDVQYHFHTIDPWLIRWHAYVMVGIIYETEKVSHIESGQVIFGLRDGQPDPDLEWVLRYEDSMAMPLRTVLDVHTGEFAAGGRA